MYEKKLIQLLCSEDYENILLALQLFEGIEEIPSHLQFALSLVGFLRIEILAETCLLYTSDAADDMQCVDLGGRRIIKKG